METNELITEIRSMDKKDNSEVKSFIRDNNLEDLVEHDINEDLIDHNLTCSCGKDVYRTYTAARKMLKQRASRGYDKDVYKCHICGYFHLTTKKSDTKKHKYNRNKNRSENKTRKAIESYNMNDIKMMNERKNWHPNKNMKKISDAPVYSVRTFSISDGLDPKIVEKLLRDND